MFLLLIYWLLLRGLAKKKNFTFYHIPGTELNSLKHLNETEQIVNLTNTGPISSDSSSVIRLFWIPHFKEQFA